MDRGGTDAAVARILKGMPSVRAAGYFAAGGGSAGGGGGAPGGGRALTAVDDESVFDDANPFGPLFPPGGASEDGKEKAEEGSGLGTLIELAIRIVAALIFGCWYYTRIVKDYPMLEQASPDARALMEEGECEGCGMASNVNGTCARECPGARAAHTYHSAGVLNYWVGLILMPFCQPCIVCYFSVLSDTFRSKLGGRKLDLPIGCALSFCCSCCLIAKEAQALDLSTKTRTSWMDIHKGQDGENRPFV